jgi:hypothetical protein
VFNLTKQVVVPVARAKAVLARGPQVQQARMLHLISFS